MKRGGRKEMQLPADAPTHRKTDNTMIKALARAFRWKGMLESGEFKELGERLEDLKNRHQQGLLLSSTS